jgi:hypothetical protein
VCVAQVVKAARGRNLFFSDDPKTYIAEADMIFVSVNTCVFRRSPPSAASPHAAPAQMPSQARRL